LPLRFEDEEMLPLPAENPYLDGSEGIHFSFSSSSSSFFSF
jgi:hypothetical protein